MKKFEAATGVDENGQPIVRKVRKYNKSGALRKPYQSRKAAKLAAAGEKSPNKKGNDAGGDGEHTIDNNSTANSSLNTSVPAGPSGAPVTKRKYQKRKKLMGPSESDSATIDPTVASTPAGSTGLAKVEGTKLIIQKKAFKLALSSANSSGIFLC